MMLTVLAVLTVRPTGRDWDKLALKFKEKEEKSKEQVRSYYYKTLQKVRPMLLAPSSECSGATVTASAGIATSASATVGTGAGTGTGTGTSVTGLGTGEKTKGDEEVMAMVTYWALRKSLIRASKSKPVSRCAVFQASSHPHFDHAFWSRLSTFLSPELKKIPHSHSHFIHAWAFCVVLTSPVADGAANAVGLARVVVSSSRGARERSR
jgi:hypothetical protein